MDLPVIRERAGSVLALALKRAGTLPDGITVDGFIAAATNVGDFDDYKVFPEQAHQIVKQVAAAGEEGAARAFLRAAIAQSVINAVTGEHIKQLPPLVFAYHTRQLARISEDHELDSEWLNLGHDLFHKEFGIATFRLYAAGAQLVDRRCGVPRSYMFKDGVAKSVPHLATMMKLGGFRPYFQIHTHSFMLDLFNEPGWEACYQGCVELYGLYPEVLGMFGASWFYDPAVVQISPRLSYLQSTPLNNGAHAMYVQTGGDAINNSLSTSPSRRKLYDEGNYMPKSYLLVWGKEEQRAWAARTLPPTLPLA
jgi:hypothetical protein